MADLPYDGSRLKFGPLTGVSRSRWRSSLSLSRVFLRRRSYTGSALLTYLPMWVGRALPLRGPKETLVPRLKRSG